MTLSQNDQPQNSRTQPLDPHLIDAHAADVNEMRILHELSARLVSEDNIQVFYDEIMRAAIALTHADAGTVQMFDASGQILVLLATQGITQRMAERFYYVDASSNTPCGIALARGERALINFDVPPSEDPDGSMRMHVEDGYLSGQSTPLITRSGKPIGMVSTHWRDHHQPTERELRLLDLLARQAADLLERQQTRASLRASEAQYRSLFESIDEGFCLIEVLFDDHEQPVDYCFLEVNPMFEQQTGIINPVGKWVREIAPEIEPYWFEIYGRVALTGEPIRFENRAEQLQRDFDVYAFRVDDPAQRHVAILFKDITERKQVDMRLRQSAERDAFRVALSDAIRPLRDPVEIQAAAYQVLGQHLNANRVLYYEITDTDYVIERDYVQGVASFAGRYPITSFGAKLSTLLRAGHTAVSNGVEADPDLTAHERAAYAHAQVGAYIGVPLIKEGEFVAGLSVHSAKPRDWTANEIALVEETAERTWAAIERARSDLALREAEERVRTIIDSAKGYAIFATNLEDTITTWNTGAEYLFGYRETEAIGMGGDLLYTPEDRAAGLPQQEIKQASEEGFVENENWHLRKDGTRFFAHNSVSPIRNPSGTLTGFTKVVRDITARHLAEQRTIVLQQLAADLAKQTASLDMAETTRRAVYNAVGEAIVSTFVVSPDREAVIRLINTGLSPETQQQYSHIPLESKLPVTDAVHSGNIIWIGSREDYLHRYPQLSRLIIEQNFHSCIVLPLSVDHQVIGCTTVTFQYPKQLSPQERELLVAIVHLCAQAVHRAQLFEAEKLARQEAEEANALKLKFLAMISHELRTPLTSIKGFASTLLSTDVQFSQENQQEFLQVIDEEADKLTALVEQLLDLSRLQSGTMQIHPTPHAFEDILKIANTQLQTLTSQHRLSLAMPHNLPQLMADPERIAQVLVNLVGNAAKFSPPSSVITITAAAADHHVQLEVSDQGIGIPVEDREKVFEAFQQVSRKIHSQRLGAGLGLAICKSIVEAHHGRIWIQDRDAPGTTIVFTLPIATE